MCKVSQLTLTLSAQRRKADAKSDRSCPTVSLQSVNRGCIDFSWRFKKYKTAKSCWNQTPAAICSHAGEADFRNSLSWKKAKTAKYVPQSQTSKCLSWVGDFCEKLKFWGVCVHPISWQKAAPHTACKLCDQRAFLMKSPTRLWSCLKDLCKAPKKDPELWHQDVWILQLTFDKQAVCL